jgi:RNA polymerase sigma-70 factor (ECF subfamily)
MANNQTDPDIGQLVAEHHRVLFAYAYRLTGAVADAEDLTQQTFLTAQEKLGQLRDLASVRGWLFTILRNNFLNTCRKKRPQAVADLDLNINSIPATVPRDDEIDHEKLQQALDQLAPNYRIVLAMFYFEECSYREIAERLELPIGTVMSRLARAKGYLRSILMECQATADPQPRPDPAVQQG